MPPDVVVDDEGDVIAGWTQARGQEGSDVIVATRRVGGSFGERQTLATGTTGLPPDRGQLARSRWATGRPRSSPD